MKIKKLNLKLKHGEIVIFENEREKIGIGGSGKDENGDYRNSDWCDSIDEVLQTIGKECGFTRGDLKKYLKDWKYIKSIPWALSEPIPEGTKVLISDNAKEECEKWGLFFEMEEMIGKVYEIDCVSNGHYVINKWCFPRQAFTIAVEEEEETDEMKNAMDLLKENGYKIIKE